MTLTAIDAFDEARNPPLFKQPDHPLWPQVRDALLSVYDPDIHGVSVYELGLIYDVAFTKGEGNLTDIAIKMTLTSANCPAAQQLPVEARDNVSFIDGVGKVTMQMVWSPQWSRAHMSDVAKVGFNLL